MKVARTLPIAATIAAATLAQAAPAHSYPASWIAQARCIHHYEAAHDAPSDLAAWPLGWHNRSNPQSRGGMQFLYSTWQNALLRHRLARWVQVGRHVVWVSAFPLDPADATKAQQLYVAWLLYIDDGRSWHEWSTAAGCGLR